MISGKAEIFKSPVGKPISAGGGEIDNGTHELENAIDKAMKYMFDWLMPTLEK